MKILNKLFGNKEEVKVEKIVKPKKKTMPTINGKEAYRIEKEKRKEQARLTRIKEEKELKEKQEAELKARIEQEKVESAKRAEKASNTKKEVIKKVEDKKVVKEEKLDLFGFEIDLVKQGDVVEVEVLEEERENYLVKIKSNFQEAKLPKAELGKDSVKIGDTVKVIVWKFYAEEFYVSVRRLENKEDLASKMSNIKEEDKVIGTVTKWKEPNFTVELENGLLGKVYVKNIDTKFVKDGEPYVGNKYEFVITKVFSNAKVGQTQVELDRRIILSENLNDLASKINVGDKLTIDNYEFNKGGISFDYNGIRGFVPVSEISYKYYANSEEAKEDITGSFDVLVKEVKKERGQLNLISSIKATLKNPFDAFVENNKVNTEVKGKVSKVESFGLIVELAPGLRGLLHNTDMTPEFSADIKKVKVNDTIDVYLKEINTEETKISLTKFKESK